MKKKKTMRMLSLLAAVIAATAGSACARELPEHTLLVYASAQAQPVETIGAGFLLERAQPAAEGTCDVDMTTLRATVNGVPVAGDDLVVDACGASAFVELGGRQPGDAFAIEIDVDGVQLAASAVLEPARLIVSNARVTFDAPLALAYDGPTVEGAALALNVGDGEGSINVPLGKHMRVDARDLPAGSVKLSAESAIVFDVDTCEGVGAGACTALDLARVEMPIVVDRF